MTDKELLELAAKAHGGITDTCEMGGGFNDADGNRWSPLTENCDLYELAKKLKFVVDFSDETVLYFCENERKWHYLEDMNISIERRIVRAAAEIGKTMP